MLYYNIINNCGYPNRRRGVLMNERNATLKKIFILVLLAITIILAGTLGTYAYFMLNLGREERQKLTLTSGTLALVFEDNSDGVNATLSLGESVTKEFKIRNIGSQDVKTSMLFNDMINTYIEESLSYKLEYKTSEEGAWIPLETASANVPNALIPSDRNLAKDLEIPARAVYYYKLTITFNNLDDIDQKGDLDAIFASKFKLGEATYDPGFIPKTVMAILNGHPVKGINEGNPNFAMPATTDEGMFALEDDYGTSYYYRGAVENNYVKFGDFYWRIVRINGDGSLRIIYDGTQGYANGANDTGRLAYTEQPFNANHDDTKYVGWMFGGAQGETSSSKSQAQTNETNSDLKTIIDSWYKENIVDKNLDAHIADEIFCNDRTVPGKEITGWNIDTGLGYGSNYIGYGATARTNVFNTDESKVQPRFTCPQKNDAFTVSDEEKGNGDLIYPVGLITADEVLAAGSGKYLTANESYYLYKGPFYWTMTPGYTNTKSAGEFMVHSLGIVNNFVYDENCAVAPVINLKPDYVQIMIGDGTINNPYREADIK